jgi:ribosome-associated protein
MNITLEEKVSILCEWLEEKKAFNIKAIDVRDKCSFTEYIVVCTGSATLHNRSLADYILEKAKEHKFRLLGKEGLEALTWILLDLNDLIIHIFTEETANMYSLEDLWTRKNIIEDNENED